MGYVVPPKAIRAAASISQLVERFICPPKSRLLINSRGNAGHVAAEEIRISRSGPDYLASYCAQTSECCAAPQSCFSPADKIGARSRRAQRAPSDAVLDTTDNSRSGHA